MSRPHVELDPTLIARDNRDCRAALELIVAAWEEAEVVGVKSDIVAYAAIYTALTDLVAKYGEEPVAALSAGLAERVRAGEFSSYTVRH